MSVLGASLSGEGSEKGPADRIVDEILKAAAVVNSGSTADFDQATAMVDQAISTWERIDILVSTTGILRNCIIFGMAEIERGTVMAVHLKGTFSTTHAASITMRQQRGGQIINTSSVSC